MVIVISDLHLDKRFNLKIFNILNEILSSAEQVIINGDFWDSYECTFDEFVNSEWSKLFSVLKSKKTVYIEGNHDPIELMDERVTLFSSKLVSEYKFKWNDKIVHILHGHQYKRSILKKFPFLRNTKWIFNLLKLANSILEKTILQEWGDQISARSLKKKVLETKESDSIVFCGHSHVEELDMENGYVNSGEFRHDLSYVEIDNESIILKRYGIQS